MTKFKIELIWSSKLRHFFGALHFEYIPATGGSEFLLIIPGRWQLINEIWSEQKVQQHILLVECEVIYTMGWKCTVTFTLVLVYQLRLCYSSGNSLFVPVELTRETSSTYGALKSFVLSLISLDNKLRYCFHFSTNCVILPSMLKHHQQLLSARIWKVQHIYDALLQCNEKCNNFIYLDADIVISETNTNLFNNSFFLDAMKDNFIGVTKDLNISYYESTTAVVDLPSRYQTGVIFGRNSAKMRDFLLDWLTLHHTLKENSTNFSSSVLSSKGQKAGTHVWDSDQHLLNILLQQKHMNYSVFTLLPRHVYNAFPVWSSTDHYYTSPSTEEVARLWRTMRLPEGDEVPGESQLVHFAGTSSCYYCLVGI